MTIPDRIFAKVHGASTDVISGRRGLIGGWNEHRCEGQVEFVRAESLPRAGAAKQIEDVKYICGQWEKNQGASSLTIAVRALLSALEPPAPKCPFGIGGHEPGCPAASETIVKGLLSDAAAKAANLGKFGHHPDPAIDFEIEIESLQARLIDAKGGVSKPGEAVETVASVLEDIERAMTFRVGGDPSAVRAKQTLRDLEADARQAVQSAAPEGQQEAFQSWWDGSGRKDCYDHIAEQAAYASWCEATRPREQAEPAAAYTIDHLGCEYVSRDVASVERIAANCSGGPTDVSYLYTGPSVKGPAEDALVATFKACVDADGVPLQVSFKGWTRENGLRFLARAALSTLSPSAMKKNYLRAWNERDAQRRRAEAAEALVKEAGKLLAASLCDFAAISAQNHKSDVLAFLARIGRS